MGLSPLLLRRRQRGHCSLHAVHGRGKWPATTWKTTCPSRRHSSIGRRKTSLTQNTVAGSHTQERQCLVRRQRRRRGCLRPDSRQVHQRPSASRSRCAPQPNFGLFPCFRHQRVWKNGKNSANKEKSRCRRKQRNATIRRCPDPLAAVLACLAPAGIIQQTSSAQGRR